MIEIVNLADRMDLFKVVAGWIWYEWSGGNSIEDIEYMAGHCLGKDDIPQTFVALVDKHPIGTVSLWRNDLKSRQDLFPWLACLYVIKEYRNRGIGKELQEYVIKQAASLGYESLYLITLLEDYYERNGWIYLEDAPLLNNTNVKLYQFLLSGNVKE